MKNRFTILTIISFAVLISLPLPGQNLSPNSDSIRWSVSGFHNSSNGEDVTLTSVFDSRQDSIVWIQQEGEYINRFAVSSSQEVWSNIQVDGSILFNVTLNSLTGTILFKREAGQTKIIMSLLKNGVNVTPFEFNVTGITKTPNP